MKLNIEMKSISGLADTEKQAVNEFSCGNVDIDSYLHNDALSDHICNLTRTFILFIDGSVAGYFTLTSDRAQITKNLLFLGNYLAIHISRFIENLYQRYKYITLLLKNIIKGRVLALC